MFFKITFIYTETGKREYLRLALQYIKFYKSTEAKGIDLIRLRVPLWTLALKLQRQRTDEKGWLDSLGLTLKFNTIYYGKIFN